ncbi:MAG: sigma-70 family RNA polymerase sigma factor [Prevotella sp.]|jgi:RNA polymerase sigma-70 factor (ECF subfamily)|nr:sigma-70 family RNA polymerase sigma factor [Prevotella sp.]MBO7129741.1 sigma-70 family RNA polymerase sigma factor [Prevotella sp.]MBP5526061.1 sigma-70 family RNA polymerase sigma factor [Paludibacteraceae bacterium]
MEQKEFETLIRQIRPKLYAEALRLLTDSDEAEDVTQETVLKLWTIRQQLEIYRSMEALAVVMVRRLALSRKRVATTIPLSNWQQTDTDSIDSPEDLLISREEETKVIKMISTLPDAQQTVLRMKHIDGLETSEIARITGSSEEAIRQNLSRARKKILKMFMQ